MKEDDIVGGSVIYRRALMELLYELHKRRELQGSALLKTMKPAVTAPRADESVGMVTSMVDDAESFL